MFDGELELGELIDWLNAETDNREFSFDDTGTLSVNYPAGMSAESAINLTAISANHEV